MTQTIANRTAATAAEAAAPAGNRAYSLVYAFTLLWTLAAILPTGAVFFKTRDAGFGPAWLLLPFLGLLCALAVEGPWEGSVSLLKRTALIGTLGLLGGFALTFSAMMGLAVLSPVMSRDNLPVMGAVAVGFVVLLAVPLLLAAWDAVRRERGLGGFTQALALLLAVASLAALAYFSAGDSHVFTEVLRRGQSSFIAANVVWFVPSYGLSVALWRRWVTG